MSDHLSTLTSEITLKDTLFAVNDAKIDASDGEVVGTGAGTGGEHKATEPDQATREQVEAFNSKRPRVKKGSLQLIVDLPLEIAYEILGRLNPVDLLHLARTSKGLRAILTEKENVIIWQNARANLPDLPECPEGFNELWYAELVFGKTCCFCGRVPETPLECFVLRIRTCAACVKNDTKFVPLHGIAATWKEFDTFSKEAGCAVEKWLPSLDCSPLKKSERGLHLGPIFRYLIRVLEECKTSTSALTSKVHRAKWLQDRKEDLAARKSHATSIVTFLQSYRSSQTKNNRRAVFAATVESRMLMLVGRARALGWTEDIIDDENAVALLWSSDLIVTACKKDITVKRFKALEEEIERVFVKAQNEYIDAMRLERLKQAFQFLRTIRAQCTSDGPIGIPQPTIGDLFQDPAVREACISYAEDFSVSVEEALSFVKETFPDLRERWIQRCKAELLHLKMETKKEEIRLFAQEKELEDQMIRARWKKDQDIDVLQLATTYFRCTLCDTSFTQLRFPKVLLHKCARAGRSGGQGDFGDRDWIDPILQQETRGYQGVFNLNQGILPAAHNSVPWQTLVKVLIMLGLNPATATVDQLKELDPIVECTDCHHAEKGRCLMSWTSIVPHITGSGHSVMANGQGKWVKVDDNTAATARQLIATEMEKRLDDDHWTESLTCGTGSAYKFSGFSLCTVPGCMKAGRRSHLQFHIVGDHFRHPNGGDIVPMPEVADERPEVYVI